MGTIEGWKAWEGRYVAGKFPLRHWLGGSDHSAVFLTERSQSGPQKAAIKLIAADGTAELQLARWRAAAQLSHPNLIRIVEAGRSQVDATPLVYLVMELAEEDLSQILPQRALAPGEVTDLLPPLLDALAYLHDKGFVHGRIKPSNILAVGDQLKLSSDQVAPASEASSKGRRRDVYDAPETAAGIVSPAGDLWSVGVTLVAALTQNVSFAEESSQGTPILPDSIPEPFYSVARDCLHLDPKQRYSIADIRMRLRGPARSVPFEPEVSATAQRSLNSKLIFGVLLAAALVGGVIFFSRGKNASAPREAGAPANVSESTPANATAPTVPPASAPAPNPGSTRTSQVPQPSEAPRKAADSPGDVVQQVMPDVPRSASNTITGTIKVAVQVNVDASGKVTQAKFTSAGSSKYFANLALKAAERWEFSPPVVNGQPSESAWVLRFRFRRGGTQVSPERLRR
jgi:TonB family protein